MLGRGDGKCKGPGVRMSLVCVSIFISFFRDFIYLFLKRGEGREKERERNINMWLSLLCPQLAT